MLMPRGPWPLNRLGDTLLPPFPQELGSYLVAVPEWTWEPSLHGPSRFLYIGGMKPRKNSSVAKRLWEFIGAACGGDNNHSGGRRFYRERYELAIGPCCFEFWWYVSDDPQCCEVRLFEQYYERFGTIPRLNGNKPRVGCGQRHLELQVVVPW
jgi:hypothetical protein